MMATSIEPAPPIPVSTPDGPAPRKRRKRAPAAGAADDCFTCSTRGARCDRRRPYCTQCLEEGKECSGYKTQLTWGMGVASRGKLRGLSLPVAGTKKVEQPPSPQKPRKRPSGSSSQRPPNIKTVGLESPIPGPGSATTRDPLVRTQSNPTPSLPSPYSVSVWNPSTQSAPTPTFQNGLGSDAVNHFTPFSLQDGSIPLSSPGSQIFPSQHKTMHYGYHHQHSQPESHMYRDQQPLPTSATYLPNPTPQHSGLSPILAHFNPSFPEPASYGAFPRADKSYVRNDTLEHPVSTYRQSILDGAYEAQPLQIPQSLEDSNEIEDVEEQDMDGEGAIDSVSVYSAPLSVDFGFALTPFSSGAGIGKTPRMQFLINYYAEVISPVIVAFDGPNNPYRTQILRLAQSSETLQHAISALAASNLRQRRETGAVSTGRTDPARRSSMAHLTLTDETWQNEKQLSPQDQAREETFHKNFAIQSLNQQLADPVLRQNDSILAVLLILCLFHICDSGIAKFQTQFAGVKKLLSLRGHDLRLNTPETKWFTRMFTWFDAMTASVNDREGLLQGHHLDISALSDEEWSLENLAGCDGQLFRTIAKLGRLNVLSQGKPVESSPSIVCRPLPSHPFPQSNDYNNFDGNGWMRIIADEDLFTSKTAEPENDSSTQFWREWREIRHTLQMWAPNPTILDANNPSDSPPLTPDQRVDLANISESFRYSALLYTERLANPTASSTDPNIQSWVRQSLTHIKQVKSDVYLLWPLFITGSECVEDLDRQIIRERCLDIQKDSGFVNNKSCLDLIEKVWSKDDGYRVGGEDDVEGGSGDEQGHGQGYTEEERQEEVEEIERGFRFKRVMDMQGNEGEYIVV